MKNSGQAVFPRGQHLRFFSEQALSMLILLLLCSSCLKSTQNNPPHWATLDFKSVRETIDAGDHEYVPGKELYPRYSYEGLPESFKIKKSPDLSLSYKDIDLVEIKRDTLSPPKMSVYIVTIFIQKEAATRMRMFSQSHLEKRVAMEIDGKIVNIPTLKGIISDELIVGFPRASLSEIENEFKKVTDKIRIIKVE